jgi:hypothetical protein
MNALRRQKDLFCMPFPACDAAALAAQIGGYRLSSAAQRELQRVT